VLQLQSAKPSRPQIRQNPCGNVITRQ